MPLQLANRVKETSLTSGSGVITLAGAADGYQAFSSVLSSGDTTYYTITNGNNWEVGIGTYGSNTLSRDIILSSSNSDANISLVSQSNVFIAYPSEKSVYKDASDQVIVGSSGVIVESGTPSNTSNVLYNVDGTLYFNGSAVNTDVPYTAGTGLVLSGFEFNIDETVLQSGDNVSLLSNDVPYLTNIVEDSSPQLGGDLDLNSSSIIGTGNITIYGTISGINGVFNSGVQFLEGVPSDTSSTLYNNNGILYFDGLVVGSKKSYQNISSDTTLDNTIDIVFIDTTSSEVNVTMPQASGNGGKEIQVKRSAGDNLAVINASGLGNIDGQLNFTIHHLYQSITLVSNNSNWFIT